MRASRLLVSLALCNAVVACRGQQASGGAATQQPSDATPAVIATDPVALSAVRFTQAFYDWYRKVDDAYPKAIDSRPEFFAPELRAALRADLEAQRRSHDETVGMDWDPFTASQDPCDPYQAGRARRNGDTIIVAVTRLGCGGSMAGTRPSVLAKLRRIDGQWQFVDFRDAWDSGGQSVLNVLADLARDRAAHPNPDAR